MPSKNIKRLAKKRNKKLDEVLQDVSRARKKLSAKTLERLK